MCIPHFSRVASKLPYDEVKGSSRAVNGTICTRQPLTWPAVAGEQEEGGAMTDDEIRSGEAALVQTQADDALLESEPRYHALLCLPKR
jgi:hypothetical protein